jgi:hypothetical protein
MTRYALILPILAAGVVIAACGSSNGNSSTPSAGQTSPSANKQSSGLRFAGCMRTHGVPNFPDPGNNGHGGIQIQATQHAGSGQSMTVNGVPVSAPAFQTAMQECRHYLPNAGQPSAAMVQRMKTQALAMARCMRSHGVPNFPDPQFGSGPGGGFGIRIGFGPGSGIDSHSPAFQAAQQACGSIFGGAPGGAVKASG